MKVRTRAAAALALVLLFLTACGPRLVLGSCADGPWRLADGWRARGALVAELPTRRYGCEIVLRSRDGGLDAILIDPLGPSLGRLSVAADGQVTVHAADPDAAEALRRIGAVLHAAAHPHDRSLARSGAETYHGGDPCLPRRVLDVAGGDLDLGDWRPRHGQLLPHHLGWEHPFASVTISRLRWERVADPATSKPAAAP